MKSAAVVVFSLLGARAGAQQNAIEIGQRLLAETAVKAALEAARRNEPQVLEEQVRLCEIEAPPFKEQKRGAAMKAVFEKLGLENVRTDEVGNVLGERRSSEPPVIGFWNTASLSLLGLARHLPLRVQKAYITYAWRAALRSAPGPTISGCVRRARDTTKVVGVLLVSGGPSSAPSA